MRSVSHPPCSDRGVFNIEGGCYAKAIGLKEVRPGCWLLAADGLGMGRQRLLLPPHVHAWPSGAPAHP